MWCGQGGSGAFVRMAGGCLHSCIAPPQNTAYGSAITRRRVIARKTVEKVGRETTPTPGEEVSVPAFTLLLLFAALLPCAFR